jgi:hypothetical protein
MTTLALEALRKIRALRKYPLAQSAISETRILKSLNVPDFTAVVAALELKSIDTPTEVRRG